MAHAPHVSRDFALQDVCGRSLALHIVYLPNGDNFVPPIFVNQFSYVTMETKDNGLYFCGHVHSDLTSFQIKRIIHNTESVSVGWNFVYFLLHSGDLICDGDDSYGQLIQTNLSSVLKVACGWGHALFCTRDGSLYAIGWNRYGQCGQDPAVMPCVAHEPLRLHFQAAIVDCAAGDHHSLVLDARGDVYAFGSNAYGQLGCGKIDTTPNWDFIPRRLHFESSGSGGEQQSNGQPKVVQLEASAHQSFILLDSGDVFFFGYGGYFQLGSRNSDDYFLPTRLNTDFLSTTNNSTQKILQISSGSWHTLFVTSDGTVYSVGWSKWGQLGLNMIDASMPTPSKITYFSERGIRIVGCASGSSHALALDDQGIVYSFGRGKMGQLCQNDLELLEYSDEPLVVSFTLNNRCTSVFARHWCSLFKFGDEASRIRI